MTWMLTGGAGYIGAHVTRALLESGRRRGRARRPHHGPRAQGARGRPASSRSTSCDRAAVADVLRRHEVTGVVHLAAKKAVGESVERPHFYYRQNVEGAMALTEAMAEVGVRRLVYSSSAAVYGPTDAPLDHRGLRRPCRSRRTGRPSSSASGSAPTSRSPRASRWWRCATSTWPARAPTTSATRARSTSSRMVLRAHTSGRRPKIFGDDYPTPDGTCIRDYIHITDLADGHVAAAVRTEAGEPGFAAYNLGRGVGSSVREVIDAVSDSARRRARPRGGRPAARRPAAGRGLGRPGPRRAGLDGHPRPRRDVRERLVGLAGLPAGLSLPAGGEPRSVGRRSAR